MQQVKNAHIFFTMVFMLLSISMYKIFCKQELSKPKGLDLANKAQSEHSPKSCGKYWSFTAKY